MSAENWCPNHPGFDAQEPCAGCRSPFCARCLVEIGGYRLCGPCKSAYLARMQPQPPPNTPPTFTDQILPVKNPAAMTAYYLSVFSLVPCFGLALGPAALFMANMARKARAANPYLPGQAHIVVAFVLGSITTAFNYGALAMYFFLMVRSGN